MTENKKRKLSDLSTFHEKLTKQIIIETDPATRISTEILARSAPLRIFAEAFKDSEHSTKYDYCVLILNSENISFEAWDTISNLVTGKGLSSVNDKNFADNLLYILYKYDIDLTETAFQKLWALIRVQIIAGSVFERNTCLESNILYYHNLIETLYSIYKDRTITADIKAKIISELPKQVIHDFIVHCAT